MTMNVANGAWETLAKRVSEAREVPLSEIRIDKRFQRALNGNAVLKIQTEYHPKGIGKLLLAGIEGQPGLASIDGQTRLVALRELEKEITEGRRELAGFRSVVDAEVFPELTIEEAALLFRLRNQQRPVPPKDRDRVKVTEGDPVMQAVVEQSEAAGYVVFADDPAEITMSHLSEAKMIVRWDRTKQIPGLLTRALTIQARAFETPEGNLIGTLDPKVLAATAWLMTKNPTLVEDELIRVMSAVGLPALQQLAKAKADTEGTRTLGALKTILVERYNKGKRGSDRISR